MPTSKKKPQGAPATPNAETRERIIENILSKRLSSGQRPGVYAAEVCQICGQIGTFSGYLCAMIAHVTVNGATNFACGKCRKKAPPSGNSGSGWAAEVLAQQSYRFCQFCQARVDLGLATELEIGFCCPMCIDTIRQKGLEGELKQIVRDLIRTRHLNIEVKDLDHLRAFDVALEGMKIDLEETLASGKRREQLKRRRPALVRAALTRLEKVHGVQPTRDRPGTVTRRKKR